MSKSNYLIRDAAWWQQIIDEQLNHKRNFRAFNTELLHVAQAFLNAFKQYKKAV